MSPTPALIAPHRPARRSIAARLMLVLLAICAAMAVAQPAAAQDSGGIVQAQVKDQRRDERGRPANEPVPGVTITVLDANGNEVGSGVTDDRGIVQIEVPTKDSYTVVIDENTLPEGMSLSAESAAEQTANLGASVTGRAIVNFFTGESQRTGSSTFDRWSQRIADGLRLGLVIAMCAVGLSLIFGTTGLTNFAHGEMVTFGAMVAWFINREGVHILIAAPIAVAAGAALGWAMDAWGFAKLRQRGVGLISQMVITIGLSLVLKNLFLSQFGGSDSPYFNYTNQVGKRFGPVVITPRDGIVMILSVIVLLAVALTLQYTQLGKATRAVSDNRELASATGIDTRRIIRLIWVSAGALAALGGVFRGLDEQVGWDMGTALLFLMFSAITLGGLGSAYGALVGGLIVGLLVEMSTLFGVPSELKTVPALAMLVLILLVRPQGILGRAERVG